MHALRQYGPPAGCRIVETRATDKGPIVVLLMEMQGRSAVGLGLDHVFFGRDKRPLGKVRLHIRLPDYVPLLEEYVDRGVRVEYDPKFLVLGERCAPGSDQVHPKDGENRKLGAGSPFQRDQRALAFGSSLESAGRVGGRSLDSFQRVDSGN